MTVDVPFYISELLFKHDCVILPGFGGFVTNYAPAKIHPINHTFYPPSKNVSFNSKLTRDDGLLIDFIAAKEKIDYAAAREKISAFIESTNQKLNKKEKVILKDVGSFKKEKEGKLLFHPAETVNYLDESFGLTTFVSPPVIRKNAHKRLEKKFTDRKPIPVKERNNRKIYWALVVVVPVLLLTIWFVFFYNTGDLNKNMQQTGILPLTEEVTNILPPTDSVDQNDPPLSSLNFKDKSTKVEEEAVATEPEVEVAPKKQFYIIGGAFSNESNADKLVVDLKKKGYTAERAGLSKSGLHMVSYFTTADKDEALMNLSMIRKNDNPAAWLLKK